MLRTGCGILVALSLLSAAPVGALTHTKAASLDSSHDQGVAELGRRKKAKAKAPASWRKLGERQVNGGVDFDSIKVGADEGRYTRVKLAVEDSALELYDVVIHFGDGSSFSPDTRYVFSKDSTSRTIDLPGGARVIRRVDFKYGNLPGGGRATLQLWAL